MASSADAEIILKLYELRTEAGMRAARQWLMSVKVSEFESLAAIQRDFGSEHNGYLRQVTSYWEMAAALVLNDALDPDLFLDANNEPFFLYAKFTPYLEQWREAFGMPFMRLTGKMIETYPQMQDRYTIMVARLDAMRKAGLQ